MNSLNNSTFNVLGVNVSITTPKQACDTIKQWILTKQKTYVCVAPVATIVDAQKDDEYRSIINSAGMVTPDGMPVVWIGRRKGHNIERTYGPDLLLNFCSEFAGDGFKNYFLGGTEETLEKLSAQLKRNTPNLNICGSYAPENRDVGQLEEVHVIEEINQMNPDILWVGLGSPKQDFWMKNHRSRLNVPVIVGVGAAFDFISGTKKQAPKWMRQNGFEWIYRLCSEPGRLWRRYLIGNTQFVYYLLKEKFKFKN